MNNLKSFIIFVSLVLLIYGGANTYIYRRISTLSHLSGGWALALKLGLLFCILAYPVSRSLFSVKALGVPLTWIGGFWLAAMTYLLLGFLLTDLVRFSDLMFGWFPNWLTGDQIRTDRIFVAGLGGLIVIVLIVGRLIAMNPSVRTVQLKVDQLPEGKDGYKVVLFSDVHLGSLVGKEFLNRLVDQVNGLNADLILIPGDVFDENPAHVPWATEPLSRFRAKDGVIVSTGNHEFYSDLKACVQMVKDAKLTILRDETVTIPGTAVVVGLDDITASRQFSAKTVPISDIIKDVDPSLPVLVLNHTPGRIAEARLAGVDLIVSGHTHGGQLWPFDYITRMVYGVKRGVTVYDKMNFFLTVGAGIWGPPIRIGASPEVVVMELRRG